MRKLGLCAVLIVACGGNNATPDGPPVKVPDAAIDAKPIDAASFDFSCAGAQQGSATATVAVSGTAETLSGMSLSPVAGATLELRDNGSGDGSDTVLATVGPTDSSGNFTFTAQSTGGKPLDVYVFGQGSNSGTGSGSDLFAAVFPADPLVADQAGVPVPIVTQATLDLLKNFFQVTEDPTKSLMVLQIADCSGTAMSGVSVTLTQNGTSVGDAPIDLGTVVSQAAGTYFIPNIPPGGGALVLGGTIKGHTLAAHNVKAFARTAIATQLHP